MKDFEHPDSETHERYMRAFRDCANAMGRLADAWKAVAEVIEELVDTANEKIEGIDNETR